MSERPLSALVAQGWELQDYSVTDSQGGEPVQHCFLLRRQAQFRVLTVRKKMIGDGYVATEMEV